MHCIPPSVARRQPRVLTRGFSLLELILVMLLMGIMSALCVAKLTPMRARQNTARSMDLFFDLALACQSPARQNGAATELKVDFDSALASAWMVDGTQATRPLAQAVADHLTLPGASDGAEFVFTPLEGKSIRTGKITVRFDIDGQCDTAGKFVLLTSNRAESVVLPAGLGPLTRSSGPRKEQP